jgi:hypothetical protein
MVDTRIRKTPKYLDIELQVRQLAQGPLVVVDLAGVTRWFGMPAKLVDPVSAHSVRVGDTEDLLSIDSVGRVLAADRDPELRDEPAPEGFGRSARPRIHHNAK